MFLQKIKVGMFKWKLMCIECKVKLVRRKLKMCVCAIETFDANPVTPWALWAMGYDFFHVLFVFRIIFQFDTFDTKSLNARPFHHNQRMTGSCSFQYIFRFHWQFGLHEHWLLYFNLWLSILIEYHYCTSTCMKSNTKKQLFSILFNFHCIIISLSIITYSL